jgi:hypothetical protein
VEIRKITIQRQPGQKVSEIPISIKQGGTLLSIQLSRGGIDRRVVVQDWPQAEKK